MTDPELDRLARELTAATDKLNSEDFLARQARYLKVEAELAELTESLEGDEAAVVKAQQALTAHVQANYLSGFAQPEPVGGDNELFEDVELADHTETYADEPEPNGWDETASSRAAGALS